jgi:hypothetical protein
MEIMASAPRATGVKPAGVSLSLADLGRRNHQTSNGTRNHAGRASAAYQDAGVLDGHFSLFRRRHPRRRVVAISSELTIKLFFGHP